MNPRWPITGIILGKIVIICENHFRIGFMWGLSDVNPQDAYMVNGTTLFLFHTDEAMLGAVENI